jgi:hypothetical protein
MLAYHQAVRKQGASYALKDRPDQHRAICGGNAGIHLLALVVGPFADELSVPNDPPSASMDA